jgi:hypothetical protein
MKRIGSVESKLAELYAARHSVAIKLACIKLEISRLTGNGVSTSRPRSRRRRTLAR